MKLLFIWLLVTCYVSVATSANILRSKRDLVRIQNLFRWLFGTNERNAGRVLASDNSDNDSLEDEEIYITPSYENIYYRTEPWPEVNLEPHVFAEVPYPRLRPLEPSRYIERHFNNPIVVRNYPPQVIREFARRDYEDEKRMYSDDRKLPLCRNVVVPLYYDTTNTQEACIYDDPGAIITTTREPIPRPPLYIQNRMHEIILGHRIPSVAAGHIEGGNLYQKEIVMPSPHFRNVGIYRYPLRVNMPKEDVNIQPPLAQNSKSTQDIRINQFQLTPSVGLQKKVQFTRPVHSRYSYKMLYHNEPHKNVVVNVENTHDIDVQNDKQTELPIVNTERKSRVNPILSTEAPLSRMVSSDKRFSFTNQSKVMYNLQQPYINNVAHDVSDERTAMSQRKLKTSVRVNDRGDIPQLSL